MYSLCARCMFCIVLQLHDPFVFAREKMAEAGDVSRRVSTCSCAWSSPHHHLDSSRPNTMSSDEGSSDPDKVYEVGK
jgi:hypothetical protein